MVGTVVVRTVGHHYGQTISMEISPYKVVGAGLGCRVGTTWVVRCFFGKETFFAQRTIQESQFSKYKDIYSILTMDMPRPNMVIYLDASIETLMHRIAPRGREFEKNISEKYLMQLSEDYAQFMNEFEAAHPDIPVLRFNGDEMDFILRKEDLDLILTSVSNQLQKGVCS